MPSWWQPGQLLFAGFEGTELPDDLATLLRHGRVGGVILFARNLRDPHQVRRLVRSIHDAAPDDASTIVAIDQEGGRVQRLRDPWTEWPPMRTVGELDDLERTAALGRALAHELLDMGIGLDFAPDIDVDTNPQNPIIGDRSFGRDAARVGRHGRAFVDAMQAEGVAACAKHFPGHGDTNADSHLELPRLDHSLERLRAVELPPFRDAVAAGVASIMTAHVLFPELDRTRPATLSPDIMALLREELGYDGLVFSDDLEMRAVADHFAPRDLVDGALQAGVDALLVCKQADLRDEVLARLERSPDGWLEEPLRRLVALKERFVAPARDRVRENAEHGPPYEEHRALARDLTGSRR